MNSHTTDRAKVDTYTRTCLTIIAVLLTVLIVGLWADGVPAARPAGAAAEGFGNAAKQRKAMIEAQQKTNAKLDALMGLLRSGEVKVRLAGKPDGERDGHDAQAP
ncbi:MAG: hypothetical protein KGY99_09225 [Phycisphaerae bacterium]|nr:hypothetical protein [Phycisphaerae bacterium]